MELPKAKKTTLVDSIVDIIINKINNEELKLGGTLPNEIEMSNLFGVSRATIRESTAYLIGMGIIERNEQGLQIIKTPSSAIQFNLESILNIGFETQVLYEARTFFDNGFAYLASSKISDKDIIYLEKLNDKIISCMNDEENYWKADLEFHYQIARIADNGILFSIYEMIMQMFTNELSNNPNNLFNQKEIIKDTPINHANLIEAFKSGRPVDALTISDMSLSNAMENMMKIRISQAIPK
jgi:GntR family transcriptional regulator, transcriptional repressor for pyruvate dehydrogenase complex